MSQTRQGLFIGIGLAVAAFALALLLPLVLQTCEANDDEMKEYYRAKERP